MGEGHIPYEELEKKLEIVPEEMEEDFGRKTVNIDNAFVENKLNKDSDDIYNSIEKQSEYVPQVQIKAGSAEGEKQHSAVYSREVGEMELSKEDEQVIENKATFSQVDTVAVKMKKQEDKTAFANKAKAVLDSWKFGGDSAKMKFLKKNIRKLNELLGEKEINQARLLEQYRIVISISEDYLSERDKGGKGHYAKRHEKVRNLMEECKKNAELLSADAYTENVTKDREYEGMRSAVKNLAKKENIKNINDALFNGVKDENGVKKKSLNDMFMTSLPKGEKEFESFMQEIQSNYEIIINQLKLEESQFSIFSSTKENQMEKGLLRKRFQRELDTLKSRSFSDINKDMMTWKDLLLNKKEIRLDYKDIPRNKYKKADFLAIRNQSEEATNKFLSLLNVGNLFSKTYKASVGEDGEVYADGYIVENSKYINGKKVEGQTLTEAINIALENKINLIYSNEAIEKMNTIRLIDTICGYRNRTEDSFKVWTKIDVVENKSYLIIEDVEARFNGESFGLEKFDDINKKEDGTTQEEIVSTNGKLKTYYYDMNIAKEILKLDPIEVTKALQERAALSENQAQAFLDRLGEVQYALNKDLNEEGGRGYSRTKIDKDLQRANDSGDEEEKKKLLKIKEIVETNYAENSCDYAYIHRSLLRDKGMKGKIEYNEKMIYVKEEVLDEATGEIKYEEKKLKDMTKEEKEKHESEVKEQLKNLNSDFGLTDIAELNRSLDKEMESVKKREAKLETINNMVADINKNSDKYSKEVLACMNIVGEWCKHNFTGQFFESQYKNNAAYIWNDYYSPETNEQRSNAEQAYQKELDKKVKKEEATKREKRRKVRLSKIEGKPIEANAEVKENDKATVVKSEAELAWEKAQKEKDEQTKKLKETYRDVPTMLMDIEQNKRNAAITALNELIKTQEDNEVKEKLEKLLEEITKDEKGELVVPKGVKETVIHDDKLKHKEHEFLSFKDWVLFPHEPSIEDINQGNLGDCWFMSTLAAVVENDPSFIKKSMKDNGDTVTVRLFDNKGSAVYITVDKSMAFYKKTKADPKGEARGAIGSLWVSLYEKALYVSNLRMEDSGDNQHSRENGYKSIESGNGVEAMKIITGKKILEDYSYFTKNKNANFTYVDEKTKLLTHNQDFQATRDEIRAKLKNIFDGKKKRIVMASTYREFKGATGVGFSGEKKRRGLASKHEYTILGLEGKDGQEKVRIRNPWGEGVLETVKNELTGEETYRKAEGRTGVFLLSLDEFVEHFRSIRVFD
ncbi:MAG: hypothetical protein J6N21_17075 [Butyrivibrio sp.]|nr:hypothetical protein [Butyrivibrio sp.]